IMTSATAPISRLTKKTQCHEKLSVRKPPRAGPIRALMPNTAPNRPWYLPRSAGGNRSPAQARGDGEDRARAEALQPASGDQLPHLLRDPGQGRADQEEADSEHHHRPSPEQARQPSLDRAG